MFRRIGVRGEGEGGKPFIVEVRDSGFNIIFRASYPVSKYFENAALGWARIRLLNIVAKSRVLALTSITPASALLHNPLLLEALFTIQRIMLFQAFVKNICSKIFRKSLKPIS